MVEGEEILYRPCLHWMFILRPIIALIPLAMILFFLWSAAGSFLGLPAVLSSVSHIHYAVGRHMLILAIILVSLILGRRLCLYLGTEYGVTNKRLMFRKGTFAEEVLFDRIESIFCVQGLLGRLFNYGTVSISGVGGKVSRFYMVAQPYALRYRIADIIEKNKVINVVQGDLPREAPKPPPPKEEEPPFRYGTFVRIVP